ncbi:MAG: ABC transporter ATP-binding protein [Chloroflexota bacterium]
MSISPDAAGDAGRARAAFEFGSTRVTYPGSRRPALDDVTFVASPGQFVGVAGRTGAGKSTLALAAAGFIPRVVRATIEGELLVAGLDPRKADPGELLGRVGIVFATPANQLSASKLTVREELAFGLENLAVPRGDMDARIDAVLARLGIEALADRDPFALSGGEQQRVAIASVIAMGTASLVLDEPTAQLDPAGTGSVAELLAELAGDGVAVICVEHDPTVLARSHDLLVLDEGRVVAHDTPGVALGTRALAPIGIRPPTLVAISEAVGVPSGSSFDPQVIAEALRGAPGALRLPDAPAGPALDAWTPVRSVDSIDIEIEDVCHTYPSGAEALRGITLSIPAGQSVALVGQNGSGKTTLVKHLNGLLRATEGHVRVGSYDAADQPVHRLASLVGFVFQNPDDQLFERSIDREVAFGPRRLGLSEVDVGRLVDQAVTTVGLAGERSVNPYDLDLSRRKLVGLASVLAMDPAIVVLDEPTTGQDAPGVDRVGSIVGMLRRAGRTVIAITHDMEFAAGNFDRIVVLRQGEVVGDGRPEEVFAAGMLPVLRSTGLRPPPAAELAITLGIAPVPLDAAGLIRSLQAQRAAGPGA